MERIRRHEAQDPVAADRESPTAVVRTRRARAAPVPPAPTLPAPVDAWPAATRIRPSAAPVVQRQTLTQASLDAGLTDTKQRRAVVGDVNAGGGLLGKVYDAGALSQQGSRAAAIQAAAAKAAVIGNRVGDWGYKNAIGGLKKWTPAKVFTRIKENMDNKDVDTVDPFFHSISVPYTKTDASKPETLRLVYQHAATLQGYVSSVTDTGSKAAPTPATMYHGKSTGGDYSDQHAPTGGSNLLAMTDLQGESAIDAYTKLAGEGARWLCVRDNAAKLANDSLFYIPAEKKDPDGVYAVRFDELWVSWASHFEKQYNIANSWVADLLWKGRLGRRWSRDEINPSKDVAL